MKNWLRIFSFQNKPLTEGSIFSIAWRRFLKNKISLIALLVVSAFTLFAVLGYLMTPDSTPYANEQNLVLMNKKPGFSIITINVRKNEIVQPCNFIEKMLFGCKNEYLQIPIKAYSFEKEFIIVHHYLGEDTTIDKKEKFNVADVVYPIKKADSVIVKANKIEFIDIHGNKKSEDITALHSKILQENIKKRTFLLGTDRFGRDLLSQLIIGTRVSLSVGFIAVLISLLIGITLGAIAGYYGKWLDALIVWFINVVWSIPTFLLVIAISFVLGKGFWQVFIAVGLTMWVEVARVVRGQVLSLKEKEYIEAARALGFSNMRIILKHILPNIMGAIIVISAANFASAILIEAGLSFLGLGVQPPIPSWGTMIKEHYGYIVFDMAYLAIIPGIAIMVLVLAFMLIGNGLRDALDVKSITR